MPRDSGYGGKLAPLVQRPVVCNGSARHPLPLRLCEGEWLFLEHENEQATLWASEKVSPSALSEVMRAFVVNAIEREPEEALSQRIAAAYAGGEGSAAAVVGKSESAVDLSRMMQDLPAVEDLLESANDAPIIRMLNALLTQAAKDGASDIHIEPYERASAVRFRVDGTLREVVQPNKALHAALISRLKIMAELDISEKRLPQDGRISLRIGGRAVDVRVSTCLRRMASVPCCVFWTRVTPTSSPSNRWA